MGKCVLHNFCYTKDRRYYLDFKIKFNFSNVKIYDQHKTQKKKLTRRNIQIPQAKLLSNSILKTQKIMFCF